jgi:hypothetical protein
VKLTLEGSCALWRGTHGTDCESDWHGVAVYPMCESAQAGDVEVVVSMDDFRDHARMTFCRDTDLDHPGRDWIEVEETRLPVQIYPPGRD